ncbi:hypothetical protein N825_31715 [Skermanella stibiiresistens SB22]|uniref:Cytochrome c domain-containing protein n=1 Tax=Skermanella stibiiresistens SB22 TaxID=1385369 RepID=W9GTM3_9PROT|nr:di-heme-cytochrome C peroxidase [Skermanella stibiiresistens]EWY36036.1 hypothetical protein N825_31715 [Skermanella stibiiresistens SB22]
MNFSRILTAGGLACAVLALTSPLGRPAAAASPPVIYVDQGDEWTETVREDYYSRDQGSRLIPMAWIAALKQPDGKPFLADNLSRYGYLPNKGGEYPLLPLGFNVAAGPDGQTLGMTCSACHTRQIQVDKVPYRIDGGPAIADFQTFLSDLDAAVGALLKNKDAFNSFSVTVIGPKPSEAAKAKLRGEIEAWYLPYHTIVSKSLPADPWGPSRLDAVTMIFNRLTGLDIGTGPTHIIADNIKTADAPVRYPFLWNAPIQDMTQWPGFSPNGNSLLALSRNLGEVFGVFGIFHPKREEGIFGLRMDYLANNSADFLGLQKQEKNIIKLGPPKWPWAINESLAIRGRDIFNWSTEKGGCVDCHGITKGKFRSLEHETWGTPLLDVGTDTREWDKLGIQVKTGVMEGAFIPLLTKPLKPVDSAFNVLGTAVIGSILQHSIPLLLDTMEDAGDLASDVPSWLKSPELQALKSLAPPVPTADPASGSGTSTSSSAASNVYESRVLEGIWAAAPYLHNGSVPTLADLLKPAAQRTASFKIGQNYDIENVGLAVEQTQFDYVLKTTDCSNLNSGNSRCGHEYGTSLSADDKKALLEYLKQL